MPPLKDELARVVVDALDSGLAILDSEGRALAWNKWLESASGIRAVDAVGRSIDEIFPGTAATRLPSAVRAALELGSSSLLSHTLHPQLLPLSTRAGQRLVHNVAVRPIGDMPYVGCVIQIADVTLAAQRETVLRQRQNARYDAVVESALDPILTFDATGEIQFANPAAELEFGYPRQELLGRRLGDFLQTPDAWDGVWSALTSGAEVQWPVELTVRRRDGSASYVDASAGKWLSDARVFVTAILRNVNARHAAEAELRALNETLEDRVRQRTAELERAHEQLRQSQKMEAIGQLTGGVAHDFNNLLTPILGGLDILQRRGLAEARDQRLVEGALQSAERAQILVQRLLAFARRQPLKAVAIDLSELVHNMTDLFGGTIGPRIRVVTDVPADLPQIQADPNQLEMALLNLAVNARDAMPDGGTLTISARAAATPGMTTLKPGRYVKLAVSDTGTGMSPETLSRAIEPFFSTKGIGKGTGLGLSMIHGLAAQLGGTLDLTSAVGVGTRVDMWLPVARKGAEQSAPGGAADQGPQRAGLVLLVDDEDLVRDSTSQMLTDLGFSVIEASSGIEALEHLGDPRITLIITDHLMPGVTGAELAREAQVRGHPAKILIISGFAELDELAPDLPRLTKPFRQSDLAAALNALSPRLTRDG
jgi:PAS domain S-box-containing protein